MLVLGLIMVLLGTSVYLTLSRSLVDQVDRNLMARSDQAFSPAGGPGHSEGHDGYSGGTFYVAIGADGQVMTNPQHVQVSAVQWPVAQSRGTLATVTVNDEPTRVFITRGPNGATLIIGQSLQPEQAAMNTLLIVLVAGGGLGLLLSICGAWFLSGRALIPIRDAFRRQQSPVGQDLCATVWTVPVLVVQRVSWLVRRGRMAPPAMPRAREAVPAV